MQSKADRKEAIKQFKERKPLLGAFAVRCTATGSIWVGSSRNLYAAKNGAWFCLRHGDHPDKSLQQEWNAHGESAFEYEILEKLEDDLLPLEVGDLLKKKRSYWLAQLGARAL
jgi:hypothetical protein